MERNMEKFESATKNCPEAGLLILGLLEALSGDEAPQPLEATSGKSLRDEGKANTPLAVVVKGEECITDAGPKPCADTCEDIKGSNPPTTRIEVNATVGLQGAVEAFKKCLDSAGFKNISIRSE